MARKGFKPLAAALAVVEELAGVGRHRFGRLIAAPRQVIVELAIMPGTI